MEVGFLHPGMMGESLAASCSATATWSSEGRSAQTANRAEAHDLVAVPTLQGLCDRADVIVSICPPGAAEEVAAAVVGCQYEGLYVDANAISPATARRIGAQFDHFVDGSVVGPPAHHPGTTRLFLSGARAREIADLWDGSVLDAIVLDGDRVGAASALKMAYATWTKVSSALLLNVRALAEAEGVADALAGEWERSQPGAVERSERVAGAVSAKAWRFVGEMEQIADSFHAAGLPSDFAAGAAEIYERMAGFKGSGPVELAEVVRSLLTPGSDSATG